MHRWLTLVVLWCVLGCAPPSEQVVLLGESGGSVTIETGTQTRTLTTPLETATVRPRGLESGQSTPADVQQQFGSTLRALPDPPPPAASGVTLYFASGSSTLPADAEPLVAAVIQAVGLRRVVAVDVVGHTDRAGGRTANERLAAARAIVVRDLLLARGLEASLLRVESRGEREPVVPTGDGVAEPLNRRVEVRVREGSL